MVLRRWEGIAGNRYRSDEGVRSKRQLFYSLCWSIYVFNSVVNTKLPDLCSAEIERDGNEGNCYE